MINIIIPDGHPGDAFLQKVTDSIRARFGISHATIQIETAPIEHELHHREANEGKFRDEIQINALLFLNIFTKPLMLRQFLALRQYTG